MEINVSEHAPLEEDKNYTNIISYTYSALCLLGKSDNKDEHVEPCFPMAKVDPYEFSLDDDNFSELMSKLKHELALCFDSDAEKKGEVMEDVVHIDQPAATTQEEFENHETTSQVTVDSENDITPALALSANEDGVQTYDESGSATNVIEQCVQGVGQEEDETDEFQVFASTYEERRNALRAALPHSEQCDEEGRVIHYICYYLCDFDENFAFVEKSEWKRDEGHSDTKGRLPYVFNDSDKSAVISGTFEEMFVKWLTKDEVAQLDSLRAQYEELVRYKADREKADRESEFDAVIQEFSYLEENEEFNNTVSKNRYSYSTVEELRNACYMVKGKYSITAPSRTKNVTEPVIPVGDAIAAAGLHDRFHERFGKK